MEENSAPFAVQSSPALKDNGDNKDVVVDVAGSKHDMHHASSFATGHATVYLKWANVCHSVTIKNPKTKKEEQKMILKSSSGYAMPGELLVIMGPSGAGKTTLLNCLAGKNMDCAGSITLNGLPWSKKLKKLSSYVQQDDLFVGEMTVREHLLFQANLRMDRSFTKEQRIQAVEEVMGDFGLAKVRDTLIGTPGRIKGISGGERKRLSLAAEVLVDPAIMFVDEPTSGLDSFMAESVVKQLHSLAKGNRTIITTIHQPSSDVYALFDKLLLVADGRNAYFGKASAAVDYFAGIGFQCPSYSNPADYFMTQLSMIPSKLEESRERIKLICDHQERIAVPEPVASGNAQEGDAGEIGRFLEDPNEGATYKTSFFTQLVALTKRALLITLRNPLNFRARLGQSIFLAVLVGLIYLRVTIDNKGVQDANGALFFVIVNQAFSNTMPVVQSFPAMLPLFLREHHGGMYSVIAFFSALTTADIPFQILWPGIFGIIVYWMVGFSNDPVNFLIFLLIVILVSNTAISLAYMISCLAPSTEIALVILPLVILPFMIFGGFFVNDDSIPVYFIWLQYASFIRYGFHAAAINQWKDYGDIYYRDETDANGNPKLFGTGLDVLSTLSISENKMALNILILFAMMIGFRVLAFLFLLYRAKVAAGKD